jgi:hypothetical protein
MAGGTCQAPAGGFTIYDLPSPESFTIRTVSGAAVVLSGGLKTDIFRIAPPSQDKLHPITFEFITFADGITGANFLDGGMTRGTMESTTLMPRLCHLQIEVAGYL